MATTPRNGTADEPTPGAGPAAAAPVRDRAKRAPTLLVIGGLAMTVLFLPFTLTVGPPTDEGAAQRVGAGLWGVLLGVVPNLILGFAVWRLRPRLAGTLLLPWVACTTVALALWASAVLDLLSQGLGPPIGLLVLAPALLAASATSRPSSPPGLQARRLLALLGSVLLVAVILVFVPAGPVGAVDGYRIFGTLAYAVPGLIWAALGLVLRNPDVPASSTTTR